LLLDQQKFSTSFDNSRYRNVGLPGHDAFTIDIQYDI
jgi:hypothetical protein